MLTPEEAWDKILEDRPPFETSSLDYRDDVQLSRSVVIAGETWAVLVRRVSPA
jgi:hypothetical protein